MPGLLLDTLNGKRADRVPLWLMRQAGLYAVSGRKFKPRQERGRKLETKNLLLEQNIRPTAINQVWHSDITYIPTDEGWLYLAGVMDGFSKRLVGYAMQDKMKTDLVIQALRSAVSRRKPAKDLIHHSDKGAQYTSYDYQRELKSHDMQASFTGTGACLDNAIIESFWAVSEAPSLASAQKATHLPVPFQNQG